MNVEHEITNVGDSGYALSERLLVPFKKPRSEVMENAMFNETLSSARVVIENAIGELKNRFSILRGIPVQVRKEDDFAYILSLCQCTILLHNLSKVLKDDWEDLADDGGNEDPISCERTVSETSAETFREQIKRHILRNRFEMVIYSLIDMFNP
jgi:hypothetical protein